MTELGSVVFQVGLEPARTLTARDAFSAPAAHAITRWDAADEGVTFVSCFLLGDEETPEPTPTLAP